MLLLPHVLLSWIAYLRENFTIVNFTMVTYLLAIYTYLLSFHRLSAYVATFFSLWLWQLNLDSFFHCFCPKKWSLFRTCVLFLQLPWNETIETITIDRGRNLIALCKDKLSRASWTNEILVTWLRRLIWHMTLWVWHILWIVSRKSVITSQLDELSNGCIFEGSLLLVSWRVRSRNTKLGSSKVDCMYSKYREQTTCYRFLAHMTLVFLVS